jgi:uncharacterized protein YecE (DUF72 family)
MGSPTMLHIGTAGWSVPKDVADQFPPGDSLLERYAQRFSAVEINASFYKLPQLKTLERWASVTPADFRFAMKTPKAITHGARLSDADALMSEFLDLAVRLGPKLGPILVQLPPSLAYEAQIAEPFFEKVRTRFPGELVVEPRHPTWLTPEADASLAGLRIARVAADPARFPGAEAPGGWRGLSYWRLHGSPRVYYSDYDDLALAAWREAILLTGEPAWCVFDNTASGAATRNALALADLS